MKKSIIMLGILISMIGCGDKHYHSVVAKVPTEPESPVVDEVQLLVDEENEYRLGLGQTMLSQGLSCKLYTITGGHRIQSTSGSNLTLQNRRLVATFLHTTVFNQEASPIDDGLNVFPEPLRGVFKNLYYLRCDGYLVVTETGYYSFELNSDDASLLYIDGSLVVDNDGSHAPTVKTGQKYLRKGVHAFRLDYAQTGGGQQALQLKMNNELLSGSVLFH